MATNQCRIPGGVLDALDRGSAILLLAPAASRGDERTCRDLVAVGSAEERRVLLVSLTRSPDELLTDWRAHLGDGSLAGMHVVTVGETTRSASATRTTAGPTAEAVTVTGVSNPSDLTGIGIEISSCLDEWGADGTDRVVCFDSLTYLLQYVETRRAFRFLHVLTAQLRRADAIAHFHLDPAAHDDRTVQIVRSLFDSVIEVDEDGELTASP